MRDRAMARQTELEEDIVADQTDESPVAGCAGDDEMEVVVPARGELPVLCHFLSPANDLGKVVKIGISHRRRGHPANHALHSLANNEHFGDVGLEVIDDAESYIGFAFQNVQSFETAHRLAQRAAPDAELTRKARFLQDDATLELSRRDRLHQEFEGVLRLR